MHQVKDEPPKENFASKVSPKRKLECGLCILNFNCIEEMNSHMDCFHEGRWKYGDPDVVFEGDDYEESESESEYSSTEESNTNSSDEDGSESQSGEE